jgi:small-conductance mechanosensitive channel
MKIQINAWTIIGVIIVVGILGAILGYTTIGSVTDRPDKEVIDRDKETHESYVILKSAVTVVNLVISSILIYLYFLTYRETRSQFTISLIIVMFAFFIYALTSNPLIISAFGYRGLGLGPFLIIPDLFTTIALATLLYISTK